MESRKIPRGIRNNNPLNIRKGNNWQGERTVQTDSAFEQFESMQYGVRAGFKLIKKYMSGYNGLTKRFDTIELIVSRWAPPSENATQRYIDFVSKETGISPKRHLAFENRKVMCDIVSSMIHVECGQVIDRGIIESAYDMV